MKQIFITTFSLVALLGCTTAPVHVTDYEDQSIKRFDNRTLNLEEVQLDIRQGAAKAGWIAEPGELPGHVIATHADGKSAAMVDIAYSVKKYSITYKNSLNLNYAPKCFNSNGQLIFDGSCIHPTYNAWVNELNNAISEELQN